MQWPKGLGLWCFNISIISWRSVLLVEETRVPGEYHRPVASHEQTSTPRHEQWPNEKGQIDKKNGRQYTAQKTKNCATQI